MATKCPKCHSENPDAQPFCGKCGTKLWAKAQISVTRTLETTPEGLGKGELFAGRFELIEELGSGGMGKVYRAFDKEVGEEIALKVLHPEIALDERTVDRFRNEIKLARRITHKNVCRMHELHQDGKQLFITMEYVPGQDLKGFIEDSGPLSTGKAVSIAKQVAEGLAEAHDLGVVHRDLKPQNIMVDQDGLAKIMDFGIARSLRTAGMTAEGMIIGTPEYMAPEQVEGLEADQRTDIYALGAILFEMVTGRVPFEGDTPLSVAYKHKNEPPIPPHNLNSLVPEPLNQLILRCLEKDKENRYQTADDLLADLVRIEDGLPISERIVLKVRPTIRISREKPKGLRRLRVPAAVAVTLVIAAAVVYRTAIYKPAPPPAPKIPNSVAIISFENLTGDNEQDIWSRRGISERFITNLENTGYFQVTTWQQMSDILKQMGKKDVKTIDSDLGFELCRQAGIESLVTGTLTKAGNIFALDIRVLDAETKKLRKSANSKGEGISSVINTQVDELSRAIAEGLGTTKEKIEQTQFQVADISTASEEAYRCYIIAKERADNLDTEKAVEFFEKALQIDPGFAKAYLSLGITYWAAQKNSSAREAFKKAMEFSVRASEKDKLLIEANYAYQVEHDLKKATMVSEELVNRFPGDKEGLVNLGIFLCFQRRYDEAVSTLQESLRLDPEFGDALNWLGIAYANLREFEKAVETLKRYIAVTPGEANPWDTLGLVYVEMGKVEEAIASYKEALKIQPDFFISNHAVSYLYAFKEDYATALGSIDRYLALNLTPERRADALGWKGFCLYWLGRFNESLEFYRQAEEAGRGADWSNRSPLHLLISELYLGRRQFDKARQSIRTWVYNEVERSPQRKVGIIKTGDLLEGLSYAMEGRLDAARAKLEEMKSALQDFSGWEKENLIENITLLQVEIRLSEPVDHETLAYIEANFVWKPGFHNFQNFSFGSLLSLSSSKFREQLARAYEQKGDFDRAIAEYERLVSPDPTKTNALIYPRFYYSLGKLYEQKGNKDEARRYYRRFSELWKDADPGTPEVEDARKRLAELS